MRVFAVKNGIHSPGSITCSNARQVKRILNEECVTELLIAFQLEGRSNGLDVLNWALKRGRLPSRITVVETNILASRAMGRLLVKHGFKTLDQRGYIRLPTQ